MHILEIPSFFPPYGGEFCIEQSKALTMMGHEVRILANVQLSVKRSYRDYFLAQTSTKTINIDGITVIRKEMRGWPKCVRPNVRRWLDGVENMFEDYVKEYGKPDIIHAHCAKWAGYAALRISRRYDIPYVVTEHLSSAILNTEFKDNKAWQIKFLKQAYYDANMVVPVSEELVEDISYYYGKDYRWKAISNTIDTDFFHYKQRPALNNRPFRFCCLANFTYNKGYDILLPAFDDYCRKHPDAELHIAGMGTDGAELTEMISHYPCAPKIKVYGCLNKEGVRNLLYDCDCLVLASRGEVQPLSILEAMGTGIPAISTEVTPRSLRIDGGCFVCPVNDTAAFSRMMCHVRENYGDIDGKKLSEKVTQMASMKAIGEKLDGLFSAIVEERKAHR